MAALDGRSSDAVVDRLDRRGRAWRLRQRHRRRFLRL